MQICLELKLKCYIKCYIYPSIFTAAIVLSEKMGFHQKKIEFKKISTETENSSTEQKKVDASTFEKIVKEQKRKLENIFENWWLQSWNTVKS